MSTPCSFDGCDRPRRSREGLCQSHVRQLHRGRDLAPLGTYVRVASPPCSFEGCGRPHAAHGLCSAHVLQMRRTGTLWPIGEPRPKAKVETPAQTRAPRKRTTSALPPGWDRLTKPAARKPVVDKAFYGLPVVAPTDPRTLAAVLQGLRDLGAEDLAEAIGVTPDQIRAEAERWELWEGTAA